MIGVVRARLDIGLLSPDITRPNEKLLAGLMYVASGHRQQSETFVTCEKLSWTAIQERDPRFQYPVISVNENKRLLREMFNGMAAKLCEQEDPLALLTLPNSLGERITEEYRRQAGKDRATLLDAIRNAGTMRGPIDDY